MNLSHNLAERQPQDYHVINPSGKLLDQVCVFNNPIMKSTLISYKLEDPVCVRIEILSLSGQTVKELFLIAGNPGGRRGENKVVWDGTNHYGVKVPFGTYKISLIADQTEQEILFITY